MVAIENGRLCIKTAGRDAGELCVITNVVDDNFAKVVSAGRKKKRKVNVRHLEPLPQKIDIKESDEAMHKMLKEMQEKGEWGKK